MLKASQSPLAGKGNFETENMNYEKHCKSYHELKNYSIIKQGATNLNQGGTNWRTQPTEERDPTNQLGTFFVLY